MGPSDSDETPSKSTVPTPALAVVRRRSLLQISAWFVGRAVFLTGIVWLGIWSFKGVGFDFTHLRTGLVAGFNYLGQMVPKTSANRKEDLDYLKTLWGPLSETIQMAVVGTVLGAIPALPISFVAARTGSLFRPISVLIKTVLNIFRAVPTLVYALIVVAFVGLGPSAGSLAIASGSFVMLAKLYAEALESVSPGPVEAVKAAGGNGVQTFVFAMLPQVFPNYISATLYAFEFNLAASFVVGIVGAGGIGYELLDNIQRYQLLEVGVLIMILVIIVNMVDYLSYRIRVLFS